MKNNQLYLIICVMFVFAFLVAMTTGYYTSQSEKIRALKIINTDVPLYTYKDGTIIYVYTKKED